MAAFCSSSATEESNPSGSLRPSSHNGLVADRLDTPLTRPHPLRVLLADPQPIFREGLAAVLLRQPDIQIVGQAASGQEALDLFAKLRPDLLIMDAEFPDMHGKEVVVKLLHRFPSSYVLIVSHQAEEETIYRALVAGAKGYCLKDAPGNTLIEAVRRVCAGNRVLSPHVSDIVTGRLHRVELTARELEVLGEMVAGRSNQEIATRLFIAEGTVKAHIVNIFRKMDVDDRTQAVLSALRRGLMPLNATG